MKERACLGRRGRRGLLGPSGRRYSTQFRPALFSSTHTKTSDSGNIDRTMNPSKRVCVVLKLRTSKRAFHRAT